MNIVTLKDWFFIELEDHYSTEETESFFYLLTEHFIKRSRLELALDPNFKITHNILKRFESTVERLIQNEPIQYIIGSTDFLGLNIKVDKFVLIPRPETEELVNWILKDIESRNKKSKLSILDIGTGSGCIAIALAKKLFNVDVDAIDISEEALKVAKRNGAINGVEVNFIREDILQVDTFLKSYDIIVSNPPYVTLSDKEKMSANVVDHEPEEALFVPNKDPMIFYRHISKLGQFILKEKGSIYFEINEYLSDDLLNLKEIQLFPKIELRKDIFGKDRMIKCSLDE
jgi:release factor glutamine methyltransferase